MTQLSRPNRRFAAYAVGCVALFGLAASQLAHAEPTPRGARTTYAFLIVCGSITMLSTFHRSRHAEGRRAKAWFVLSFGAVCGVASNGWTLVTDLSSLPDGWAHYGDPVLLAALIISTVGLVMFPPTRRRRADLARMVLDGLVIGGSVLFVTSVTIFPQLLEAHPDRSLSGRVQDLFLPVMDVLIATLAVLLITRSGRASRVPLVLLGTGFWLYTISDLSYAVLATSYSPALGTYRDLGWVAGYLIFALAARHHTAGLSSDDGRQEISPVLSTVVMFALFLAATAFSLQPMRVGSLPPAVGVVWVGVILAVIVRQVVLVVDNERLRRNLEVLVRDRTRELHEITKQQELLLTSVGDGIYGVDQSGEITFVNAATAQILERPEGTLIGRNAHHLFHGPRDDGAPFPIRGCYVTEAIRSGITANAEEDQYVRGDGALIGVEATASPLSSEEGITGAVVVFRDVSQRREVDRMKSEFVSIVSHELRTPLTSIRGSLGLVAGGAFGELPPKAARMLDIALTGSDRLTRLINDILDIERIDSGTLPMNVEVCDVRTLCHEAMTMISGLTDTEDVDVAIGSCEGLVRADPDRTVQTLINLVGNAVKFSDPGTTVTLSAVPRDDVVEFSVTDHGRGIPPDKIDAVFARFTQVDSSDARVKGGTGLGLAISRTIVERLGGTIWAESEPGVGSTFRFTLPRASVPPSHAGNVDAPVVVVCDDDPSTVEVLCALIEQRGYRPVGVTTGEAALAVVRDELPAAVLLDLWMPGTSGAAVLTALRADPRTAVVPVIVVSGMRPDVDPVIAAEAEGWVVKPVDAAQLFATVAAAIDQHQSPGAVLVVEDDDALAGVLTELLERRGLTVSRARSQTKAIRMVTDHPPQVLVLDLGLPDGSGFDVVAQLRGQGGLSGLPVVVYSAADIPAADRQRLVLGETIFLTKSRISPQQLERRVVELIDQVTGRRPGHTGPKEGHGGAPSGTGDGRNGGPADSQGVRVGVTAPAQDDDADPGAQHDNHDRHEPRRSDLGQR